MAIPITVATPHGAVADPATSANQPSAHERRLNVYLTTDVVVLQDPEYDAVASGQAGGSVDVPDLMEESNLRRGG